jgi:DNA-binding protein HU-beta
MSKKPMTKAEFVAAIATEMGGDRKTAAAVLEAIAQVVTRAVAEGGTVALPGIGKVAGRARPARTVRNPATGAMVEKPADRQVKFTIAKSLKDAVNG